VVTIEAVFMKRNGGGVGSLMYRAKPVANRWKCGCCGRGVVQPKKLWMCKVCGAKVCQVVTDADFVLDQNLRPVTFE
jgi:hypothetical protein